MQGSIILIPFPFSDLSSTKKRPCLVISKSNNQEQDLIVLAITAQSKQSNNPTITITNSDLKEGTLPKVSYVRISKIANIHRSLVLKNIGFLKESTLKKIIETFKLQF